MECLQWHPEKKIIAVGWRSGEVTTYNDHDHDFFEQSSIHRSPLSFLRWNQSGTQLISGDKVRLKLYTAGREGGGAKEGRNICRWARPSYSCSVPGYLSHDRPCYLPSLYSHTLPRMVCLWCGRWTPVGSSTPLPSTNIVSLLPSHTAPCSTLPSHQSKRKRTSLFQIN